MNHSRRMDLPSRRRGGLVAGLLVCLVLVGIVGGIGYTYIYGGNDGVDESELITAEAIRAPFDHIVLEQGEIESSSNIEVLCEVESRGYSGVPILWVIDEGAKVKKGDKLVELDSSTIEQELKESRIQVTTAEANVTSAQALLEQAKIARQEYIEGVFETEKAAIQQEINLAKQEQTQAQLLLDSSERLVAKGLQNSLQLKSEEFKLANAKNKLESAERRLRVLEKYTKEKMLVQFDSDIDSAAAQLSAYQSELLEEQQELEDIERQLENCTIYAPAEGIVVHANRYSSRGGNAEFVVEPGASVRERQAIIQLPDPTQMQVNVKVNESRITLIEEGMPVKIGVDALPGLKLKGKVSKVNRYAEPGSWFSSSTKEYATFIEIIDPPENIRTGMNAEAQIFVEQLADALQVPIQALYEHGEQMYCLVRRGVNQFETVPVTIGATNDTMASISEGLKEGDRVVLNLRSHLNLMDLPDLDEIDNSDMMEIGRSGRPDDGRPGDNEDGPSGPGGEGPRGGGNWSGGPGGGPGGGGPGGRGGRGGPGGAGGRGPGGDNAGGPGGGGPGGGRPGGGGPGGGGPGGGGSGAGGPGGGGPPNIGQIVSRSMERSDTDGDGKLSAEEIAAIDGQFRSMISAADTDGDGSVTRAELTSALSKRMSERRGEQ